MATSLIGLGSNLGRREDLISSAIERLDAQAGFCVTKSSGAYETAPIGGPSDQGFFLNSAAVVETDLPAEELLQLLQQVEADLGRCRTIHWGARSIDLDLLIYDDRICKTSGLILPHPRMSFRRFVLEPACEIAPEMVHPTSGWTLAGLLQHICTHRNYVAVAGPPTANTTQFIETIKKQLHQQHNLSSQLICSPQRSKPSGTDKRDAASPYHKMELEFLNRSRDLLSAAHWPDPDGWLLSDFWLGSSIFVVANGMDVEGYEAHCRQLQQNAETIITPKLLVLLDPSDCGDTIAGQIFDLENPLTPITKSTAAALGVDYPATPGPLLQLKFSTQCEKQEAVEEVVAAILAMQ